MEDWMFVKRALGRIALAGCAAMTMVALSSPAALAQEAADPNPGALTLSGGYDFLNQYMFRGIRQNSTEVAMWPWADLGIAAFSGDGGLKAVNINFGTWNSLHTGDTGLDGTSGKLWYESDFYAAVGLGFGGGTSLTTTYTAYTSPNSMFTTVKEVMFKLALDDSGYLGAAAIKPYAAVAFEFDTDAAKGQADGGLEAGKYLELGVGPGWSAPAVSLTFPIKVGLSLGDYYELAGVDNKFGFVSAGAMATVPIGGTSKFGSWYVHGGVEFQKLGDTTAAFNGDDDSQVIGSIGIGFSY
jgi:hypothetical protein